MSDRACRPLGWRRHNASLLLDLSPPSRCTLAHELPGVPMLTSSIEFDSLITGNASDFSCSNEPIAEHATSTARRWHAYRIRRARHDAQFHPRPTLKDVAIGMNIGGGALTNAFIQGRTSTSSYAAAEEAAARYDCIRGQLLACARATWMMSPGVHGLDVLFLIDCGPVCKSYLSNTAAKKSIPTSNNSSPVACEELRQYVDQAPRGNGNPYPKGGNFSGFTHTSWLNQQPYMPRLHYRCYWGYLSLPPLFSNMHRKTLVLLRALADVLGHKTFFLKIDTDTLFRPSAFEKFLQSIHARAHPESPLYFGSSSAGGGRQACSSQDEEACHTFRFNVGADQSRASSVRLRDTLGWKQVEESFLKYEKDRLVSNQTQIRYSSGGHYGFNRLALLNVVESDCLNIVGRIPCGRKQGGGQTKPCRRGDIHTMEDATVGLCMHLTQTRLIECDCFRNAKMLLPQAFPSRQVSKHIHAKRRQLYEQQGIILPKNAQAMFGAEIELASLYLATKQWMSNIDLGDTRTSEIGIQDNEQQNRSNSTRDENRSLARLCRYPITLHPIKLGWHMLDWWELLDQRDRVFERGFSRIHYQI
mmetsp:Transcript_5226/g.11625  ORF Transcript_5226/g.11625 Transcript_5226/m.11625 type:complete len:587 (+) Transcript_5226:29-1789(+)